MKLCLIFSVLLLASLGKPSIYFENSLFPDKQSPFSILASAKPTPSVKVLYDPAKHVLFEIDNATSIHYTYFESRFIFTTQLSESSNESRIVLQQDAMKETPGFAIEAFPNKLPLETRDCKKNSTEQLSDLIDECNGDLRLRMLTEEEKDQILLYKVEQAGKYST